MGGAIDVWCNFFTPEGVGLVFSDNPEVAFMMGEQWGRHDRMVGYEPAEMIERMDRMGVDRVICPALQQFLYRDRRLVAVPWRSVAAVVEAHPDRVSGLYGYDPWSGVRGLREFETAVRDHGFVGGHIHPYGFDVPLDGAQWYPFYAKAAELGVPVEIQTGHSAEFMPSENGRPIRLDRVAIHFPELTIIGAHQGWPWVEEMIALAWKHPNVYVAVSGHAPRYWDPKMVQFLNSRGMGKVLWGTDWPLLGHDESLAQVDALDLKPEAKAMLLRGAAEKVFGFSAPAAESAA